MAILKTTNTTGTYRESDAIARVVHYIMNPYKARHYYGVYGADIHNPAASMNMISEQFGKANGVRLHHFVISFYPNELRDPIIVDEIARRFAECLACEYQMVYAVHEDKEQLHIHIVINSVSYIDGHRYRGSREEFKAMQHYMRAVLREYHIYRLDYVSHKTVL